jgi:phage terminase large subunit-like protein
MQSWHCTFKDLDTSDYVVGQVWGRVGSIFLLGDQIRTRMDFPTTVQAVRDVSRKMAEDFRNADREQSERLGRDPNPGVRDFPGCSRSIRSKERSRAHRH